MVEALERCPDPDAISSSQAVQDLSCKALNGALHHKLSQELFNPWDGGRHLVNKLHLLSEGGLRLLCRMYGLIHTVEDWRDLPYWLQCLECICGQSLSNFMETEDLCRNVLKCGGLEECFKSLLRQPLDQKDAISHICPNMNRLLIAMEVALYAICNLAETPGCKMPIATRSDALKQMIDMSCSSHYSCKTSVIAVSVFICITQSCDTHQHIATPSILEGFLACCTYRETHATDEEKLGTLALKCYTGLALAQLVIPSLHLIPIDLHAPIEKLMSQTLSVLSLTKLKEHDEEEGLVWCTLLPYIKLLYLQPDRRRVDCEMTPTACSIVALSTDMLLFCFHTALLREVHQKLIVKEKLVDYVVCLPWIVPSRSRPRARELVADLATSIGVDPPRLLTLAKATLAKQCQQGLDDVLGLSTARDITDKFSHPVPGKI